MSEVLVGKKIRTQDLQTDGPAVSAELRALAARYRAEADGADPEAGTFDGFDLPLTQTDLAEVSGMTPVHVSRMLSELREEGICAFAQGAVQILNLPALFQTGQYRWDHLYLGDDLDREIADKAGMRATPKRTHVAL